MIPTFRTAEKMNYNIFGTNYHSTVSNSQKTTMSAICNENIWKLEKESEKYLAKLKENIEDCNRADFDSDFNYRIELMRRTELYSSAKEILYLRKQRMADYLS